MAASNVSKIFNGLKSTRLNYVQVRNHVRIQSRNPRDPHFIRKRMLEVCKPVFAWDKRPPWESCKNVEREEESKNKEEFIHPYHQLLAKRFSEEFNDSGMICFYHVNPVGEEEKKQFRNTLMKKDMFLRFYDNAVIHLALRGTKYQSIFHLYPIPGAIVFCKEPLQISTLISLNKKAPKFIMLGGLIEDRLLSMDDLVQLSSIPSIDYVRGQTVGILAHTGGGSTSSLLAHQQMMLRANLDQLIKQLNESSSSSPSS